MKLRKVNEGFDDDKAEFERKFQEMPFYQVENIDGFFDVYGFDEDEEDEVRDSAQKRRLFVFQDSSVYWGDGERLLEADSELMDEDSFHDEAQLSGAEVVDPQAEVVEE